MRDKHVINTLYRGKKSIYISPDNRYYFFSMYSWRKNTRKDFAYIYKILLRNVNCRLWNHMLTGKMWNLLLPNWTGKRLVHFTRYFSTIQTSWIVCFFFLLVNLKCNSQNRGGKITWVSKTNARRYIFRFRFLSLVESVIEIYGILDGKCSEWSGFNMIKPGTKCVQIAWTIEFLNYDPHPTSIYGTESLFLRSMSYWTRNALEFLNCRVRRKCLLVDYSWILNANNGWSRL